ncbi:Hsp90 cochaperone [Starmerella bacillaris]|uniref:Hsp90 cochaperone n=1 Tax=Starmerella bacillaris TaxID=1247836 RepID=A0AAV5RF60_STABA|nr:Hsp90 cochaperone [Starmerella bacillaris]
MANADELKAQGNAAFSSKNYPLAVDLFTQAIEASPEPNSVLYSNRSGAYASMREYAKALEDGNKAVEIKPDWAKAYNRQGAAYHGLGEFEKAISAYDEALKLDSNNAQAKQGKKSAEDALISGGPQDTFMKMFADPQNIMKLQQNPRTREYLKDPTFMENLRTTMQNPMNVLSGKAEDPRILEAFSVILGLPTSHTDEPMPDAEPEQQESKPEPKASKPETKETKPEPEAPGKQAADAEKAEGNKLYKERKFDEAIARYDAAWSQFKDITYLNNRAAAEFEKGDYDAAIKTCLLAVEESQELHSDYKTVAKSLSRIGSCYLKLDNLKEAIQYFEKSLTEHRSPDVLTKLRATQRDLRIREEQAYIDPEKAEAERERGNTLFKEGKFPDSVKAYTEAIKRNPQDVRGYGNRAAAYLKLMDYPDAVKDCDKAIELDPKFIKAYTRKATAYNVMKQYRKAMDVLDQAREIDVDGKNSREIEDLYHKASTARFAALPGETEDQRTERLTADPEIDEIRRDPIMNTILQQASSDPAALRDHMKNPEVRRKVNLLAAAGIIRTR